MSLTDSPGTPHMAESVPTPSGVLHALGLSRPELRAWALYDWANSAMVTTILTAVFPIFYAKVACSDFNETVANRYYATATTIGMIFIAVISPFLGAIADYSARKKQMLGAFLALGLVSVALMFFISRGQWMFASILFILANIGANGSFVFYDALLPHIASDEEVDRVSTAGYALGYLGGGILLAINLAWISKPEWFGLPSGDNLTPSQATLPARLSFLSVALWWFVFSIPLFRRVPEPRPDRPPSEYKEGLIGTIRVAAGRLKETAHELGRYRQAVLMLAAFLIYNDGIGTIMRMAAIYATELKISSGTIIQSILLVQFVGIPCSFAFGGLAGKIGAKMAIFLGLLVYVGICIVGYFMETDWHFLVLAVLVGLVQGGTQALSRSLFASMIPRDKSGEFFGFFAVVEKFAGIIGPAMFAVINLVTGSSRGAILAVISFFVIGGALLAMVDVAKGQALARTRGEG